MVVAWIGSFLCRKGGDLSGTGLDFVGRFVSDGTGREGEALRAPIADEGVGLRDAVLVHVAELGRGSVVAWRRVCR